MTQLLLRAKYRLHFCLLACHSEGNFLRAGDAAQCLKRFLLNDSNRGAECNLFCARSSDPDEPQPKAFYKRISRRSRIKLALSAIFVSSAYQRAFTFE